MELRSILLTDVSPDGPERVTWVTESTFAPERLNVDMREAASAVKMFRNTKPVEYHRQFVPNFAT